MPQWSVARALVPSLSVVDNAKEVQHYWATLMKLWRIGGKRATSSDFFPGSHPRSLSREHLATLHEHSYSVAYKSDGVRYVLLLTLRPGTRAEDGKAVALMIDRARTMYEVEVVAPEAYFANGTVLEGELVWAAPDASHMLFFVFDALCIQGRALAHLPFDQRLEEARACVQWSEEIAHADDPNAHAAELDAMSMVHYDPRVALVPKTFAALSSAAALWRDRARAGHRVDGLILQRGDAPYVVGTAFNECFKWKQDHTVDLAGPSLRAADGPLPATIGGMPWSASADSRLAARDDRDVLEYLVRAVDGSLEFFAVRRRIDKATPNGICVVEAAVRELLSHVRVDEL